MIDDQRERRLGDASNLQDAIDALGSVRHDHRKGFMHDRLMSAIDGICTQYNKANKLTFSQAQVAAIKDISFQIVYILDPKSKPPKGFFAKLFHEFGEASSIAKIGYVVAVLSFLYGSVTGGYSIVADHIIPITRRIAGFDDSASKPKTEDKKQTVQQGPPSMAAPGPSNALQDMKIVPPLPRTIP